MPGGKACFILEGLLQQAKTTTLLLKYNCLGSMTGGILNKQELGSENLSQRLLNTLRYLRNTNPHEKYSDTAWKRTLILLQDHFIFRSQYKPSER